MAPRESAIQFCTQCGHATKYTIPEGDNRPRYICISCGEIHYQNPKIVAGCIVTHKSKILICKRAIEPMLGYWTIPAGYLENGETIAQGAIRETWEEAQAKIKNIELYQIYTLLTVNQIYVLYRAELATADGFGVGQESLETKLVEESELPWNNMAFKVVTQTLKRFLQQRCNGGYFTIESETL